MGGNRGVRIGFEPHQGCLYVRLPADEDAELPTGAFSELQLSLRLEETGKALEVATRTSRLFPEFHRLASLLAEEFERVGQTASGAFTAAIMGWQGLVSRRSILSDEEQCGLLGELLLLESLVRNRGPAAVVSWIGRSVSGDARHDFRIGNIDLEVKATRSLARRHFVQGLQQLVPAREHALFVMSVRLEPAGALGGRALPTQVEIIRKLLFNAHSSLEIFERKLASSRYSDEDAPLYLERMILADPPRLIPVDDDCPRITPDLLKDQLKPGLPNRIDRVSYQIDLEGLGHAPGSVSYDAVLGSIELSTE